MSFKSTDMQGEEMMKQIKWNSELYATLKSRLRKKQGIEECVLTFQKD
jgi:hypothetical protein